MKNADKPASPVMIDDWHGLTKREMFAIHAMQGLLAGNLARPDVISVDATEAAKEAASYADALLKELDQ